MNYEELKKLLEENNELKLQLIAELSNDTEMKKVIDKNVTQAINSFKEKGMQNILEEKKNAWKDEFYQEFAKENNIEINPQIREMSKRMKELEDLVKQKELGEKRSSVKANITAKLAEAKLNPNLAKYLPLEDEEIATKELDVFKSLIDSVVEERVKEQLGNNKIIPGNGTSTVTDINPFAKETLNLTEQAKLMKENPEKAKMLKEQAKK